MYKSIYILFIKNEKNHIAMNEIFELEFDHNDYLIVL